MEQENKMGTMSINKLLITMSLPMMISMLVQSMYNIVDSIFVARFSDKALTAVSLCFPVQTLMIAFAAGTSIGINSILSRKLGEGDKRSATLVATNGIVLGFLTSLVFALAGGLSAHKIFGFFTKDAVIIDMAAQYMWICTVFSLGSFMQIVAEKLLISTGKTLFSMSSQILGAVVNIILDPIFIFGIGVPQMGIAGAAIATVIGQWCAMIFAFILNATKNKEISISFKGFRLDGAIIREIYKVAIPSIIMQSIISIMTVGMNKILANDTAISVFGVYYKLHSFIFMPIFGLTGALIPIVAYNFGARQHDRIVKATRLALIIALSIMALGTVLFELFPKFFLEIFNADPGLITMGVPALRIICTGFCFSGFSIVFASCFQALGRAYLSMIVSISRQLLVILPLAFILKITLGLGYVWYSMVTAEVVGALMCFFMYRSVKKNILDKI